MTNKNPRAPLPRPPDKYDKRNMSELVRILERNLRNLGGPLINIPDIRSPESLSSMNIGDIYQAGGFVKIIRAGDTFPIGSGATASVGSVTVVVP